MIRRRRPGLVPETRRRAAFRRLEPDMPSIADNPALGTYAVCTAILERWVRDHPEIWLWMHRRWKTRPPDSPTGPPE